MRISITGVPGTGKTTISDLVGKVLKMKVIHLTERAKKEGFLTGYDRSRGCTIVNIDKLKAKLKSERNALFESHFAQEIPADLILVLRLDPYEVAQRLSDRRYSKRKAMENALAEALDYYAPRKRGRKHIDIDTTGLTPYEIVEKIIKAIKSKRGDKVDHSQWIADNLEELERLKL